MDVNLSQVIPYGTFPIIDKKLYELTGLFHRELAEAIRIVERTGERDRIYPNEFFLSEEMIFEIVMRYDNKGNIYKEQFDQLFDIIKARSISVNIILVALKQLPNYYSRDYTWSVDYIISIRDEYENALKLQKVNSNSQYDEKTLLRNLKTDDYRDLWTDLKRTLERFRRNIYLMNISEENKNKLGRALGNRDRSSESDIDAAFEDMYTYQVKIIDFMRVLKSLGETRYLREDPQYERIFNVLDGV